MLHPLSSLGYNFSQRKGHNVSNLTFPTPQKCKEPCPLLCAETFLFFVPVWAKCGSRKRPGTCVKITRGTSVLPCFHESRVHVHASFFWETKEMKNWFAVGYAVSTELNVSSYLLGVSGFDGTSTKPWKMKQKLWRPKTWDSQEKTRKRVGQFHSFPRTCPNSDFIERDTSIVDESFI